jgi:hypothetical protein
MCSYEHYPARLPPFRFPPPVLGPLPTFPHGRAPDAATGVFLTDANPGATGLARVGAPANTRWRPGCGAVRRKRVQQGKNRHTCCCLIGLATLPPERPPLYHATRYRPCRPIPPSRRRQVCRSQARQEDCFHLDAPHRSLRAIFARGANRWRRSSPGTM